MVWHDDSFSVTMQTTYPSRIGKLVELHYQSLFSLAMRLCASPVQAMVLTQRAFSVARKRRDLPVPRNERAWLLALLLNKFLESRPRICGS